MQVFIHTKAYVELYITYIIMIGPDLEISQTSIKWQVNKQIIIYPCNKILLNCQKEQIINTWYIVHAALHTGIILYAEELSTKNNAV